MALRAGACLSRRPKDLGFLSMRSASARKLTIFDLSIRVQSLAQSRGFPPNDRPARAAGRRQAPDRLRPAARFLPREFSRAGARRRKDLRRYRRLHGRDDRGDDLLGDPLSANLASAVVFRRDGRPSRRPHDLAPRRDLHQDEADGLLRPCRRPADVRTAHRSAAAAARSRLDLSWPGPDGLDQADAELGAVLCLHGAAQRSRLAQQLNAILDRIQDLGRDSPHFPLCGSEHSDAVEARVDEGRRRSRRAWAGRMSDPVLSIRALRKEYGTGVQALKSVDLDIRRGEIFALLGPNGAGKTTLINIICGIVTPTDGEVLIDGRNWQKDFRYARERIGLVPQELTTEAFEPVTRTVTFSRGLFGKPRDDKKIEDLLKRLSLWDKRKTIMMQLSGGMKRRVMIAKALSHEPALLFLDEPTAGVDVELRRDMWDVVRKLRADGTTIILTTHYIEEAEEMADRVGVISKGELIAVDEKRDLMAKMGRKTLDIVLAEPIAAVPAELSDWNLELNDEGHM